MAKKNRKSTKSLDSGRISNEVVRVLQRRAEKKVALASATGSTIAATGTVLNLSGNIAQGDNFDQRTGDKICYLHSWIRTRFTAVTSNQTARFILFSDRFNQGTLPGVTEVLQTNSLMAGYQQLTVIQQKRFTIHRDWVFDCNLNGETIKSLTFTLGRTGDIYYNGSAAVSASNGRGAMFLLVIGSASTGLYDLTVESQYIDV